MAERFSKVVVEKPHLQMRYLELLKQKVVAAKRGSGDELEDIVEKMHGMVDVLINQDYSQMRKALPEAYYEVIGGYTGLIVGKTTDPDDLWAEEPNYQIREITKEQFDEDDD